MIRGVLFDLDGTLVDTRVDLARAVNHARARLGYPPDDEDRVTSFIGDGARVLLAGSLGTQETALVDRAVAEFMAHYTAHCVDHATLYPGVVEVLAALAACRLGVVSNKYLEATERILAGLGIRDRFSVVMGGDSLPTRKPDPAVIVEACARLGVPPAETVMVGDNQHDVNAGRGAGCLTVGVTYGLAPRDLLEQARPDVLIHRLPDLLPVVFA